MRGSLAVIVALGVAGLAVVFTSLNTDQRTAAEGRLLVSGQPASSELIKASLSNTQNAGTVAFTVTTTIKGTPLGDQTVTGSGAADFNAGQATFSGTVLAMPFQAVLDRTTVYVKSDYLGSGWYRINASSVDKGATEPFIPPITSPSQAFDLLKNISDNVQVIGTETINGVSTTHYRVTVDLGKAASTLEHPEGMPAVQGTVPVDVWVDSQGLIAQISVDYSGPALASGPVGASEVIATVDCTAYGQPVSVTIPPASDVKDFSASNLGPLMGQFSRSVR